MQNLKTEHLFKQQQWANQIPKAEKKCYLPHHPWVL